MKYAHWIVLLLALLGAVFVVWPKIQAKLAG